MLPARLNKPYYVFRPSQVPRRLRRSLVRDEPDTTETVTLPWGFALTVRPTDAVGHRVLRTGVHDIAVTETVFRLLDPGDLAIDIGAHVGYMTSLMAARVGNRGSVIAFEPQPDVYGELERNVATWRGRGLRTEIALHRIALSNRVGVGRLTQPDRGRDRGGASLSKEQPGNVYEVELRRLDDVAPQSSAVALMKIDVEGHELEVLQGGESLLRRKRVRDIVFEDFGQHPTPVTSLLEDLGYAILKLDHNLFGPWIGPGESDRRPIGDQSYLATTDRTRALDRMRRRGWAVLRPGK